MMYDDASATTIRRAVKKIDCVRVPRARPALVRRSSDISPRLLRSGDSPRVSHRHLRRPHAHRRAERERVGEDGLLRLGDWHASGSLATIRHAACATRSAARCAATASPAPTCRVAHARCASIHVVPFRLAAIQTVASAVHANHAAAACSNAAKPSRGRVRTRVRIGTRPRDRAHRPPERAPRPRRDERHRITLGETREIVRVKCSRRRWMATYPALMATTTATTTRPATRCARGTVDGTRRTASAPTRSTARTGARARHTRQGARGISR